MQGSDSKTMDQTVLIAWNGENLRASVSARSWILSGGTVKVCGTGNEVTHGTSVQKGCLSIPALNLRQRPTFRWRFFFVLSPIHT
jgi:hypothetical protein